MKTISRGVGNGEFLKKLAGEGFACQNCGAIYSWIFNFCPDCGQDHGHSGGYYRPGLYHRFANGGVKEKVMASLGRPPLKKRCLTKKEKAVFVKIQEHARRLSGFNAMALSSDATASFVGLKHLVTDG